MTYLLKFCFLSSPFFITLHWKNSQISKFDQTCKIRGMLFKDSAAPPDYQVWHIKAGQR